jgi:uncharacterized protein YyaL (SSP411 family)
MTPDKKPFFAGTYIPKRNAYGRLGMLELIPQVENLWKEKRDDIEKSAEQIAHSLNSTDHKGPGEKFGLDILKDAYRQLEANFDESYGGFGAAPKFPSAHNLMFLLRQWKRTGYDRALEMVENTLQMMRRGGMYDHVGFGFHRYSTDSRWFLPHFEKMLYDQAMMAYLYTEAYQATANPDYRQVAQEILEYVRRDMTDEKGGFYSAEDADSEGVEGKFYLFTKDEFWNILDEEEVEIASKVFDITATGNYADEATGKKTGQNILHMIRPLDQVARELDVTENDLRNVVNKVREKIFLHRKKRIHPHKDDKILTDWNGLMIAAFAKGAQVFDEPELARIAKKAADFILAAMRNEEGLLMHRYREGQAALNGFVDDYAFMIWGLIEIYEATFEVKYLETAIDLNKYMIKYFWDEKNGGFFFTGENSEKLLSRKKEIYDGAIPSGNSVAAWNFIRLARITANQKWEEMAAQIGQAFSGQVKEYPAGYSMLLNAVDFAVGPSLEIVISGIYDNEDTREMLSILRRHFIPNKVTLFRPDDEKFPDISSIAEYTIDQHSLDGKATAYICRNFSCELPTSDFNEMLETLKKPYKTVTTF